MRGGVVDLTTAALSAARRSWDVSESDGAAWAEDYSEGQPYRSATASTTGFVEGPPPQRYYLDGDSHVGLLRRAFLPTWAPFELGSVEADRRPLVTDEEALMLAEAGVNTITELVSADKYTILKLRGYDVPQVRRGVHSSRGGGGVGVVPGGAITVRCGGAGWGEMGAASRSLFEQNWG